MLSRFGFSKPTSIDAQLDNKRVALEEILDMEDCLGQVQMRHKKLIDFIKRPLIISQLIRHLVLGDDSNYAWIACEILASAIPSIMETLVFQHRELLLVYWALLYQTYRLTRQQVVYFCKVNQALLARRPADMVQFVTRLSDLLPHWIYHLGDPQGSQLADLLVSFIYSERMIDCTGITKWFCQQGLIRLLTEQLNPSVDPMMRQICQQVLCDITRLSQTSHQDMQSIGPNDLMNDLSSTETIKRVMDSMLDTTSPEAIDSFVCGAKLFINMIRYNDERYLNNDNILTMNDHIPTNSKILASMLTYCTTRLPEILYLLENPRSKRKDRLGMERLVLLELVAEWIHCSNLIGIQEEGDGFKSAYCTLGVTARVLDLFFAFPSCNLAHSVICDMIGQTFENKCLHRKNNKQMILEVFTSGRLIHRILEVNTQVKACPELSRTLGYMGHLTLLTKSIVQILDSQPYLVKTLGDSVPWEEWADYANIVLNRCEKWDIPPLSDISVSASTTSLSTATFPTPPPPIHIPSSLSSGPLSSPLPSPTVLPSLPSSFLSTEVSYHIL
ncbi:SIT4 phosphatase-associated protein-domain-containing protein [Halteromyces radiatus]|uniref:SIT4 phosphatase-associated protein-domain-containing protein n=1 Tax=Halteromyces radiatus TaxID=101107 RepID=UPI00221EE70D|nr:SIT4 phosphatase-associated protein-domain-containing protein [Halteromyces radiatus]KAI8084904.1 SIT4 phosphatase-associated protein-domain-containing protein [Halteromyces radiatus]